MALVSLKADDRTPARKGGARKLRMAGRVPAVLYGIGEVPKPLSLDAKELDILLRKHGASSIILDLEIEGEAADKSSALVKEIQRHTVTGQVLHVDLQRVSAERKLTVEVPIVVTGEAKGVKEGGVMETILRELQVECLPGDMPEKLEIDVSEMDIGDAIHVRDLSLPKTEILNDPDGVVLTLVPPTVYEEAKPEEEAAAAEAEEPELVKKEKEAGEAASEEKAEGKGKEKAEGKGKE
jgi:large subunit ribosomal protein L25